MQTHNSILYNMSVIVCTRVEKGNKNMNEKGNVMKVVIADSNRGSCTFRGRKN